MGRREFQLKKGIDPLAVGQSLRTVLPAPSYFAPGHDLLTSQGQA